MLQMVASVGGMMSTAGLELLTHRFPRPSFRTKLLEGLGGGGGGWWRSNLTFVKLLYANLLHLFIVSSEHDGYIGNINHL